MDYNRLALVVTLTLVFILTGCSPEEKPVETVEIDSSIYFVGKTDKRASIMKYDVKSKEKTVFWQDEKSEVLELSTSPSGSKSYFLTAQSVNLKKEFPEIKNAVLYFIDSAGSDAVEAFTIESCLQVYLEWLDNQTFRLIYNKQQPQSLVISQYETLFERGKPVSTNSQDFVLGKNPYPQFPKTTLYTTSSGGLFSILIEGKMPFKYYFIDVTGRQKREILAGNEKIKQVEWSSNDSTVVFLTVEEDDKPATAESFTRNTIYIYSVLKGDYIARISGADSKHFRIFEGMLFVENKSSTGSFIQIINLETGEEIGKIEEAFGAGLRSIPITKLNIVI
ncbi:MAG: hypothetical protein IAE91_06730 [Ignavibacteriaceae bacterium]|nr:hypothetical protein [Ignavibacteriaceae bacterium]